MSNNNKIFDIEMTIKEILTKCEFNDIHIIGADVRIRANSILLLEDIYIISQNKKIIFIDDFGDNLLQIENFKFFGKINFMFTDKVSISNVVIIHVLGGFKIDCES